MVFLERHGVAKATSLWLKFFLKPNQSISITKQLSRVVFYCHYGFPCFICSLHHACHLINLSLLEFRRSPLCSALRGSSFRSQHRGSGSCGGISRSLLGVFNAICCVDELEHAAINNGVSGISIFNFFTVNNLFLDYFYGANLRFLLLLFC